MFSYVLIQQKFSEVSLPVLYLIERQYINAKLSDQQNSDLQLDLSECEIESAISQMAKGKTPGPDGLSIEFYIQHCWPIVKDEVVSLLREMFFTQTIHPQIKTGYLTLIHKKGQKNEIASY